MIQIILTLIPFIIFSGVFLTKKNKINNIPNFLFYGILSLIFTFAIDSFIGIMFPFSLDSVLFKSANFITLFIYYLFTAGIPEELSKYVSIKLSKPKTKAQILINSIYINIVFAMLETYSYVGTSTMALETNILRTFKPMHIFYGTIMAYFLIKGFEEKDKKSKYNVLALIIPAVVHAVFDSLLNMIDIKINDPNVIIVGVILAIFAYLIPISVIIKQKPDEEEYKNKKGSSILKLMISIPIILFFLCALNTENTYIKMNEVAVILEENIEMSVLSVTEEKFENQVFDIYDGTYTKVDIKFTNNSDEIYPFLSTNFKLLNNYEETIADIHYSNFEDLKPHDTEIRTLYFKVKYNSDSKLSYNNSKVIDGKMQSYSYTFTLN